jgi:DNA repair protein RecN (Recombination protein N)
MLRELRIQNYALIEELRLQLPPGLTVLTGETGAGKSIIFDALALVLGGRAQGEQIRQGEDEAVVEAAFEPLGGPVVEALGAAGIPAEPGEPLILRRLVGRDGRSRGYANGTMTTAGGLRTLGGLLVDVHGQGQAYSLLAPKRHRELLDAFAGVEAEVGAFGAEYRRLRGLAEERAHLAAGEREKAARQEVLEHQRKEIAAARLAPDEEERLEAERAVLANVERLAAASAAAFQALYGDEGAVVDRLGGATARLREAARIDARLGPALEGCEAAAAQLQEAAALLRGYRDRLEFDPGRLEQIEERLHAIQRLKRKYVRTVAELLAFQEELAAELAKLERSEDRLRELDGEIAAAGAGLADRAERLSRERARGARRLRDEVQAELADLGLGRARFEVAVERAPDGEAGPGEAPRFGPAGWDAVEFRIAPNPGEGLRPLARIASGGELARVMLAVKVVLAASDEIPTLILDEVDAGIGGPMGDAVGRKLALAARARQVICITHLPQIAAYADGQLRVEKRTARGRTETLVSVLDGAGRVQELARMLGGRPGAETPERHAGELLAAADRWKRAKRSP